MCRPFSCCKQAKHNPKDRQFLRPGCDNVCVIFFFLLVCKCCSVTVRVSLLPRASSLSVCSMLISPSFLLCSYRSFFSPSPLSLSLSKKASCPGYLHRDQGRRSKLDVCEVVFLFHSSTCHCSLMEITLFFCFVHDCIVRSSFLYLVSLDGGDLLIQSNKVADLYLVQSVTKQISVMFSVHSSIPFKQSACVFP